MIHVQHLTKYFGSFAAVNDVSFAAKPGEILALIGPNGSGKSTIMKCIAGLISPTEGDILINGEPITSRKRDWLSYLPQKVSFPENLTGREAIEFFSRLRRLSATSSSRALEVSKLNGFGNRAVREYSTGMLQRLGIAITLMPETPVVVLDEPTAALDPDAVLHFRELLTTMRTRQQTVILSSHALAEVEALADRIAILVHGRLVACESVQQFKHLLAQQALMKITLRQAKPEYVEAACRSGALSAEIVGSELIVAAPAVDRRGILHALEANGAGIEQFSTEEPSLESFYLRYTREDTGNHSTSVAADRL